jgi:hypothetical protein
MDKCSLASNPQLQAAASLSTLGLLFVPSLVALRLDRSGLLSVWTGLPASYCGLLGYELQP